MATNFPSSLDAFTNPSSTDAMDSVSVPHATQHSDLNDAVEALEAKVGANSSAVTSSHDYLIADHASRITTLEGASGGKILQVVSTFVNTGFSTTSTSFVDVTGHTATITPTAATSKILIMYSCFTYHSNTGRIRPLNLVRDGSNICQPASGTEPATMNPYLVSSLGVQHAVVNFLDSPATTSSVVYKIQSKTDVGTVYVGRDSGTVLTSPANLTLMEVSA